METFAIAIGSFVLYLIAYHTYGRWLARRLFKLDPLAPVPSKQLADGQDYVATRKSMLFGHHFTSIAGTGPIVGPALAVIWGWLPALLWVLFGSIFIGAVHDLGALVISIRNRGQTIGEIAGRLINPRVKVLFLLILFLALTIVLAIFGLVIASIFSQYPASVLSVWVEIPLAVAMGYWVYRKSRSPHLPAVIALVVMMGAVVLAVQWPALQLAFEPLTLGGVTLSPIVIWTVILFIYCYIASTLPVWKLLQPRDYINSHQLILCLVLLVAGIGAATFFHEGGAPLVAPAVRTHVEGAPPIMPFLFITIACGAISGFHCLVSSGTTSKQIACETDAQFIGYGSMLTEGFLAVLVILACCAGLGMGVSEGVPTGMTYSLGGSADAVEEGLVFKPKERRLIPGTRLSIAATTGSPPQIHLYERTTTVDFAGRTAVRFTMKRALNAGDTVEFANGSLLVESASHVRVSGNAAWQRRYSTWSSAGGLGAKVGAFVNGAGNFVASLGIPINIAIALMAVLVASFAATTLDTATRLQRYVVQELASTANIRPLTTKHGATLFAVSTAAVVAAIPPPGQTWAAGMGKGGLILWPIFGATNQLLAGLAFLVVAFYLVRRKLPSWFIVAPAILMLVLPFCAMLYQLGFTNALAALGHTVGLTAGPDSSVIANPNGWWQQGQWHLVVAGVLICVLQVWMVGEAVRLWPRIRGVLESDLPPLRTGFPVIPVEGAAVLEAPSGTAPGDARPSPDNDGGRSC